MNALCRLHAITLGLWALATPALADCLTTFPAARVTEKMADARYQNCELVTEDYAYFLAEQGRLLLELRPAYRRKLKLDGSTPADAQAAARLSVYDESLAKLATAAAGLRKLPPPAPAASAASTTSGVGDARSAARQRLKEGRASSQTLSDRIAAAREDFQPADTTNYCKQDFMFRLVSALHGKLGECLKGN